MRKLKMIKIKGFNTSYLFVADDPIAFEEKCYKKGLVEKNMMCRIDWIFRKNKIINMEWIFKETEIRLNYREV